MFEGLCKVGSLLKTILSWKKNNSPHQRTSGPDSPNFSNSQVITKYGNISEEDDAWRKLKYLRHANSNSESLWLSGEEEAQLAPLIRKAVLLKTTKKANNAVNRHTFEYELTNLAKLPWTIQGPSFQRDNL